MSTLVAAEPSSRIRHGSRAGRALVPAVIGLVAAATAWLRLSSTARDTFWAEDGRTFVGDALQAPQWQTLFHPYAGYLHLVPRLEAIITVDLTPVQSWAESMTLLSCLVAGAVAAIVFAVSRPLLPWWPARVLVAGLTVLTPLATREVVGNAANVHSILFWGLFWVVLARPRRRRQGWALGGFALVAALTEVQSVFLLPLLLVARRDRRTWPVKAALLLGVAAQLLATLSSPRSSSGRAEVGPLSLLDGWLINAVSTSWVPTKQLGAVLGSVGIGTVALLVLIPLAAIAVTVILGTRAGRRLAVLLAAASIVVWCAGVMIDPAPWYDYAGMTPVQLQHVWLSRYGVVPAMMLLAELALAASVLRVHGRGPRIAAIAVVLVVVGAIAVQAPSDISRRSVGPAWQPQIAAAAAACAPPHVPSVQLQETIGWSVTVPCRYFDGITG